MKLIVIIITTAILALVCIYSRAEIVLIVNADSGVTELTKKDVVNIYTGRFFVQPDGNIFEPYDQSQGSELRTRFYKKLLNKSVAEMNAYWARLLFTGRSKKPRQLPNKSQSLDTISNNPDAIVYIDSKSLNNFEQIKIVYTLTDEPD